MRDAQRMSVAQENKVHAATHAVAFYWIIGN